MSLLYDCCFYNYGHISHYYDEKYKWENVGHKLIIKIDQQSTLFLLLSWPAFPLSEKLGDFVDYRKFVQLINYFLFLIDTQIIEFKIVHEVCILK